MEESQSACVRDTRSQGKKKMEPKRTWATLFQRTCYLTLSQAVSVQAYSSHDSANRNFFFRKGYEVLLRNPSYKNCSLLVLNNPQPVAIIFPVVPTLELYYILCKWCWAIWSLNPIPRKNYSETGDSFSWAQFRRDPLAGLSDHLLCYTGKMTRSSGCSFVISRSKKQLRFLFVQKYSFPKWRSSYFLYSGKKERKKKGAEVIINLSILCAFKKDILQLVLD